MEPRTWVAYVGMAGKLPNRLVQHFVNRDSSVVTGTSAAGLNIEWVRFVLWWGHPRFEDGEARHAAELVAFDVFDPVLRSRGNPSTAAMALYGDPDFRNEMTKLFQGSEAGRFQPPRVTDLARQLADLVNRVEQLEAQLRRQPE